jgi:hypothetical protein
MSPFCQDTADAHGGGFGEDDTEDQLGVPERLYRVRKTN